ncbi:MAG: ABC transporter permease [Eubacteriaceae bacterium]|nr:ABC transporter permease [Eubacteriaceae bacterium]
MNIGESISLAWDGIRQNKMRAMLTMLGIVIGIASVIAIMTVGEGMSTSINSSMSSLGVSNIMVNVRQRGIQGQRQSVQMQEEDRISEELIELYKQRYEDVITGVSVSRSAGSGKAQEGRLYANVAVAGINGDYLAVNNVTMLQGRILAARDQDAMRYVAIVSDRFVNNIFRGDQQAAIGQEIKVKIGQNIHVFIVVGVYKYEASALSLIGGSSASEQDLSTSLYIPITTAQRITSAASGYASFTVQAVSDINSIDFAVQTADFFNRYYERNENFNVTATSMESMQEQVNTMMGTLTVALSVIAGISLMVGGIGVMNIMLVSVTERTREIGIRKALGATNFNIRVQFVVESIIVCLIGGAIGIAIGWGMGYLGGILLGSPAIPTGGSIALAFSFSTGIGIFFGYYPANKAAKLDPIEALRFE